MIGKGAAHQNLCRKLIPAELKVQRTGTMVLIRPAKKDISETAVDKMRQFRIAVTSWKINTSQSF